MPPAAVRRLSDRLTPLPAALNWLRHATARASRSLIAVLGLCVLVLTWFLFIALGLGLCSENQRYRVCDQLEREVLGPVLLFAPTLIFVAVGSIVPRRTLWLMFGAFATAVVLFIPALSLAL